MKGKALKTAAASTGLLLLILDHKTAAIGIQQGIELCLKTLIPSLFPFCVLSILVTGGLLGNQIHFLAPLSRFCRIPSGCESLLLIGWIGGYPVGAQNVAEAYRTKRISSKDASRMIIICNNAGPAFIFGIIGSIISNTGLLWLIWGILILSSSLTGHLIPGGCSLPVRLNCSDSISFPDAIRRGANNMLIICSNVILMRMCLEFLSIWLLNTSSIIVKVILSGILELTNGCVLLSTVQNTDLRCIIAVCLLSFGGICVWLQTCAICREIDITNYLKWKLVQCIISVFLFLSFLLVRTFTMLRFFIPFIGLIFFLFLKEKKKSIAISNSMMYNNESKI